jgi:hypothetical protein
LIRHLELVVLLLLAIIDLPVRTNDGIARAQSIPHLGFYIAVGYAKLQSPLDVYLFGVTNLPEGSALDVGIENYVGEGSTIVSKDIVMKVGSDHLFHADVIPKEGLEFKNNMICNIIFAYRPQDLAILNITGRHGERLGDPARSSQVMTVSGGQILEATTVVHD